MNKKIEQWAYNAMVIIISDILNIDVIMPKLIFNYKSPTNYDYGIYMHQDLSGMDITLNMIPILELKNEDDIKTVITYGIIHEIMHLYQSINSKYKTDKNFYTKYEDNADYAAIKTVEENLSLINTKLNFKFNTVFINGIERLLKFRNMPAELYVNQRYIIKTIVGTLSTKLDYNFDYLYEIMEYSELLIVHFPDKSQYCIDLIYGDSEELKLLINKIQLFGFKMIHVKQTCDYDRYTLEIRLV